MAMHPTDLDSFMLLLSTTDIKKKLDTGLQLLNYLADSSKSIECQDIGLFVDNIVQWLNSSNPKVVQIGLDVLSYLADRMGHDFRPYISTIIQPTIDRLGDNKDITRRKSQMLLLKIMEKGSMSPQYLLDKLQPTFKHKNAKLREEALVLLTTALNEHGADDMALSGIIHSIVKLLSDPTEKVRETAMSTLTNIYRHVGDKLRIDLQRKHNVPQAKLIQLIENFDQLRADGCLLPQAKSIEVVKEIDELDKAIKAPSLKRTPSLLQKRSYIGSTKAASVSQAGAVDEESFLIAFEEVPPVKLFSNKDLEDQMKIIKEFIGDDKKDWKQRTDSMKKLRGIIINGGMNYDTFTVYLKDLQRPFEVACTDLRSQVVREACITLAYLSQQMKNKFASFGETVLPTLMNLIPNSAKVVATAGAVAVRFILQHTHSSRYVPIIALSLNNKSKDIRRATCEYLYLILQTWHTSLLQKHSTILQEAIKKGIADSDADARALARNCYWAFKSHFPEIAEILLTEVDATYRRALMSLSNSGSITSLNAIPKTTNISPRVPKSVSSMSRVSPGVRSTSAIDLQAAQRAKMRMKYSLTSRQKATIPRASKSPESTCLTSPERLARPRTRVSGVSQSQPSSRSGSPSSRLGYSSYNRDGESLVSRPKVLSEFGVKSTGMDFGFDRGSFGCKAKPPSRPVMAQKMLQQSREAESALADAFEGIEGYSRSLKSKGDHSDDSETSSICSERSHDSFRKHSDSFSWSGSQQRLYRDSWDHSAPKDIKDIIENCGHKHWADRKEGLLGLQHFLANGYTLNSVELRKVTDIFAKMFMDSHTKVFSLFLDTLNELIQTHCEDLGDWLYVLCTRLLNKLGAELLGSIQTKINKTLEVVREYFTGEQLLPAVMRFLTNPTQTPNSRVKIATLTFITQITETSEPSSLSSSSGSALVRLLDWTNDVKSQDVRRHAQNAVIALYNLNPSQFTMILSELPKYYQEAALPLIQSHLRRSSIASTPGSPGTPSPKLPNSPARIKVKMENDSVDDTLNPEEVYRSLRRTTAEIQNYGFECLERATSSKDSGISNMADAEERLEGLNMSNSDHSSSVSSPTQCTKNITKIAVNGSNDTIAGDLILPQENNGYKTSDIVKGSDVLDNTLKILHTEESKIVEKVAALQEFQLFVKERRDGLYVKQHFKRLLKTLIGCLSDNSKEIQIEVIQSLIEMLKCPELKESFSNYAELLVLKVIRAHKIDDQKTEANTSGNSRTTVKYPEVLRMAEKCAATVAIILPPEQTIQFASSMMTTEPFPQNMGAIKMLHKVVEHHGRDAIYPQLSKVMPGLIKAYDDIESTVRKSAVFCMVAIHAAVGEDVLKPHLNSLYGSKLKLLNIYIQRAQEANSQPSSPRNDKN